MAAGVDFQPAARKYGISGRTELARLGPSVGLVLTADSGNGDLSQFHIDSFAVLDDLRNEPPAVANDLHLQLIPDSTDGDVEDGVEGVDVSQVGVIPASRQAGFESEGAEADGADPE